MNNSSMQPTNHIAMEGLQHFDKVVVIEHNLDVIKTADWIIDPGPEGGNRGNRVVAVGTPEQVAANPNSHTGRFLAPLLTQGW